MSVQLLSCYLFCQIEKDLDEASVARMNEYGTSDDIKESFDTLQQRVKKKVSLNTNLKFIAPELNSTRSNYVTN